MVQELPSMDSAELDEDLKTSVGSIFSWLRKNGIERKDITNRNCREIFGLSALGRNWKISIAEVDNRPDIFDLNISELSNERGKDGEFSIYIEESKIVGVQWNGHVYDPQECDIDKQAITSNELLEIVASLELSDPEELRKVIAINPYL